MWLLSNFRRLITGAGLTAKPPQQIFSGGFGGQTVQAFTNY
jgi:hypothetical protein